MAEGTPPAPPSEGGHGRPDRGRGGGGKRGRGRNRRRGGGGRGGRGASDVAAGSTADAAAEGVRSLSLDAGAVEFVPAGVPPPPPPGDATGAGPAGQQRPAATKKKGRRGKGGGGARASAVSPVEEEGKVKKASRRRNAGKAGEGGGDIAGGGRERDQKDRPDGGGEEDRRREPRQQKRRDSKSRADSKSTKEKSTEDDAVDAPHKPSIPPSEPQTTNDLNYGRGQKITVLHIAEKPSIAQAIAKGLASMGTGNYDSDGGRLPVHMIGNLPFPKAPRASVCCHRITSVAGHVFNVDFPPQYQSWDSVDPAELFHATVIRKPSKGSVVNHLQTEARGVDFVCLWMDCDREGENINFEVLDCTMHLMKSGGQAGVANYDRVYRAHFSAINPSDIKKAYGLLGKPDKNQSLSVDARQELDLKVGVAFSRFQTRYFQGRYGDLDSAVLSYGPCQTPTLGFCVQRHIEIETFKPEPYWTLDLGVLKRGRMCRALWKTGRSFNKQKVLNLVQKCRDSPNCSAEVLSTVTKEKKQGRPTPFNTVAMLKAASKALGIGPHAAMQCAERLYLSGYLSYPRTESTAYPKSFDIKAALEEQASDAKWGNYVRGLLTGKDGVNKARGGIDMGDHPPITPCRSASGELSGDMARLFDLVTRHFIASVSQDASWRSTNILLKVDALEQQGEGKGIFTIAGKELIDPGWLAIVMHRQYGDKMDGDEVEDEEEKALPEFTQGELIPFFFSDKASGNVQVTLGGNSYASLDMKERMTTPPPYLSESELIGKMEANGIGTDASIATHINNIMKRYYVELQSGRKLVPTKLGLVLAQGYHLIDSSLILPKIRADIEDQCNKIAKGIANKESVLSKAIEVFANKFDHFAQNVAKMDVLFGSSFARLQDIGKPFTRCGLTRRYLQFIEGPPPRLYNKFTETVYPLPAGGVIKQWTGQKCTVEGCNFELCLYSAGNPQRTFPLCPNCFNHPRPEWGEAPGQDDEENAGLDDDDGNKERKIRRLAGKSLIGECPHPDNHPLVKRLTVSPDPNSGGVLILDPTPNKYLLVSTRDPTIVYFPKEVEKVTVLDAVDEIIGSHLMRVEFKKGLSPLPGGATKHTSNFCVDQVLQSMVRVYHGSEHLKASGRGGRGRGRGGRGGRGGRRGGRR